jgi:hypothetical protein
MLSGAKIASLHIDLRRIVGRKKPINAAGTARRRYRARSAALIRHAQTSVVEEAGERRKNWTFAGSDEGGQARRRHLHAHP